MSEKERKLRENVKFLSLKN